MRKNIANNNKCLSQQVNKTRTKSAPIKHRKQNNYKQEPMKYKINNRENQWNKNRYFENINKIDKFLLRVEREHKSSVSGRGNIATELANARKIISK